MELEKIMGEEIIYRYMLNVEEVRDFTSDPKASGWAILEVYPESQIVHSFYFEGGEEPTIRDIANIRVWKEEDFDEVAVWLHNRSNG
jgi:hypothetical protein